VSDQFGEGQGASHLSHEERKEAGLLCPAVVWKRRPPP
jgi:hypothetical protein